MPVDGKDDAAVVDEDVVDLPPWGRASPAGSAE